MKCRQGAEWEGQCVLANSVILGTENEGGPFAASWLLEPFGGPAGSASPGWGSPVGC